ncbi:hypothetical protein EJ110_NYTH50158 [Nymphaea thermarum]|nr:hypothetical protein EJ110_NYTH50158 [Nymphaea thermarum]
MKWAHFPHIQFGLSLEGNKQAKFDDTSFLGGGTACLAAEQAGTSLHVNDKFGEAASSSISAMSIVSRSFHFLSRREESSLLERTAMEPRLKSKASAWLEQKLRMLVGLA